MQPLIALRRLPQGYGDHRNYKDYIKRFVTAFRQIEELKITASGAAFVITAELSQPTCDLFDDWIRDLIMDPVTKAPRFDLSIYPDPIPYSASLTIMGMEFTHCYPVSSDPLILRCGY